MAMTIVSSANLDIRSFWYSFESGAVVYDPAIAGVAKSDYLKQLHRAEEVKIQQFEKRGRWQTMKENSARLLSPLL